ncbi:hypothetical protein PG994_013352 [Apiospora phragmitis]|uniref:Uncharacterized protein n=1 Tax=Apiospora phragmitis TaxID=2905665 RepID=A0ABR1T8D5_9PEZI
MRLAWMFVEGWRQRLRRGEKLVEKHRSELAAEEENTADQEMRNGRSSPSSNSRLSYGTMRSILVSRDPAERRIKKDRARNQKSVHWNL